MAILKNMESSVKWLNKLNPSVKRDMTKWCEFHSDLDYNTADYIVLRLEVAELLKKGHFCDMLLEKEKNTLKHKPIEELTFHPIRNQNACAI